MELGNGSQVGAADLVERIGKVNHQMPDVSLPGVTSGSWVFAVGNDWKNYESRTVVSVANTLSGRRIPATTIPPSATPTGCKQ